MRLVAQLGDVMGKPTPGGGLQIALPRRGGVQGDIVAAFVNAVWAASRYVVGSHENKPLNVRPRTMQRWAGY
jgi:hypothetical protein